MTDDQRTERVEPISWLRIEILYQPPPEGSNYSRVALTLSADAPMPDDLPGGRDTDPRVARSSWVVRGDVGDATGTLLGASVLEDLLEVLSWWAAQAEAQHLHLVDGTEPTSERVPIVSMLVRSLIALGHADRQEVDLEGGGIAAFDAGRELLCEAVSRIVRDDVAAAVEHARGMLVAAIAEVVDDPSPAKRKAVDDTIRYLIDQATPRLYDSQHDMVKGIFERIVRRARVEPRKVEHMGTYLREHRCQARIPLRTLAEQLGVPVVTLGAVERKEQILDEEHWDRLVELVPGLARSELQRLAEGPSAAEMALDDIAAICGCPHWEYPGQVVRDVAGCLTGIFEPEPDHPMIRRAQRSVRARELQDHGRQQGHAEAVAWLLGEGLRHVKAAGPIAVGAQAQARAQALAEAMAAALAQRMDEHTRQGEGRDGTSTTTTTTGTDGGPMEPRAPGGHGGDLPLRAGRGAPADQDPIPGVDARPRRAGGADRGGGGGRGPVGADAPDVTEEVGLEQPCDAAPSRADQHGYTDTWPADADTRWTPTGKR